ncbi:hypothetical protein BT93_C2053 [Corymbia citriodora subsp. variegata]|nr:hypothetical protein BT93_C2053 [Corymbia citriodora subsp. variegata]
MMTAPPEEAVRMSRARPFSTLFRESNVELEMAEPFAKSREDIASVSVHDGGDPGEIGLLSHSVPSPKLTIGDGELDAGPLLHSCQIRPEPHSALAVQVVKIEEEEEEEEEDEEVAVIADPRDSTTVWPSSSSQAAATDVARPMQGLGEAGPPPFLRKTYEMVSDPSTDPVVSWSSSRDSFVVWDQHEFSKQVLPRFFKHSNFASFIRQLNTYGFRKIDTDRWEFTNAGFRDGKKHLLKNIRRRSKLNDQTKTSSSIPTSDYSKAEKEAELEMLKKDQEALKAEMLKLREEWENSRREIHQVAKRIRYAECRCRRMFHFLSKAAKSPDLVHLIQERRRKRKLEACEPSKKGKLPGPDDEATKCSLEVADHKIQSPNFDCLRMGEGSAQMESGPNNAVPVDFETVQMHSPWHPLLDQMAGAGPSGEELATDDTGIYLELEGLIENYTNELWEP